MKTHCSRPLQNISPNLPETRSSRTSSLQTTSSIRLCRRSCQHGTASKERISSFSALCDLAMEFRRRLDRTQRLAFSYLDIRFDIPSLKIKGSLGGCASYFGRTDERRSLPLATFIAGTGPERTSAAHEVMPYLLLRLVLAHERNPTLNNYATFIVCMKGTTVQFAKANCSASYVSDLIDRKSPRTPLSLQLSEPYDLVGQPEREEFMRIYLGFIRYLYGLLSIYNGLYFFICSVTI